MKVFHDEQDREHLGTMLESLGWLVYTELIDEAIEAERVALELETNEVEVFRRQGAIRGLRAAVELPKREARV